MADNRLNKLKVDKTGQWIIKYESILDDILDHFQNHPLDEMFIDVSIKENQKDHIELILTKYFLNDVFEIVKFYPFLLQQEEYEIMAKAELVIDYLGAERLKQANYLGMKNMTIDEFAEYLIFQKKEIVNQVTGVDQNFVKGYLNEGEE